MRSSDKPSTNTLASLNAALRGMLRDDERVVVIGEDLIDPYGGAFKVTRGLSTEFPGRILTTPISEAGLTGIAAGMALAGMRPVVEIMFGDFLLLAADQILNHIAKYRFMYDEQVTVPITIRTPMGGGRGYGPTHSQSLEKHFCGMPGLRVVAPSVFHDPGALLRRCVLADDDPVLFVENKLDYARRVRTAPHEGRIGSLFAKTSVGDYPTVHLSHAALDRAELTIVTYGGLAEVAEEAARALLIEEEIHAEVVVVSSLTPLDLAPIEASLRQTGRLLVAEEGTRTAGWGAEVIARVGDECFELLRAAPRRVGALDVPIGNAKVLETAVLPQVSDLYECALGMCARELA